jgi:hypothetical protein
LAPAPDGYSFSGSSGYGEEVLSGDEDPSLALDSERPDILEVFMPPGDMEAVRRLAVVYLDPHNGFLSPMASIAEAIFCAMDHLQFECVASGLGACYIRFACMEEREQAMGRQPFFHDGVRIELAREEEAARAPTRPDVVALLTTSPFPAEHCTPIGIAATFSFGEVLEIDPVSLMGHAMSVVRAVVLVKRACDIPCDV